MTRTALRPLMAYAVEVRCVRRLSPSFLRLTFGGACLADFTTCVPRDLRRRRPELVPNRGLNNLWRGCSVPITSAAVTGDTTSYGGPQSQDTGTGPCIV